MLNSHHSQKQSNLYIQSSYQQFYGRVVSIVQIHVLSVYENSNDITVYSPLSHTVLFDIRSNASIHTGWQCQIKQTVSRSIHLKFLNLCAQFLEVFSLIVGSCHIVVHLEKGFQPLGLIFLYLQVAAASLLSQKK